MDCTLDDEQMLWQCYAVSRGLEHRDRLVARYRELARIFAAKLFSARQVAGLEFADFHQYALLGLIEAIERFDANRGAAFTTFATYRIRGAILSGIEKYTEQQQQIAHRSRLRTERTRALAESVAADNADPFLQLAEIAIGSAIGLMLENSLMYQSHDVAYEHNIYHRREVADLSRVLSELVDTLSESERKVIRYHYFQQLSFDEIATRLALSKGRISQLHRQALGRLQLNYDTLRILRTDY